MGIPRVVSRDQGHEFNNQLNAKFMQDYLDTCVYAYNTSRHDSSWYSPFEVMFGRKPVLPVEIRSDASEDASEDVNVFATHDEDALQEQLEARKKILEQAKENIVDAQQK